MKTSDRTPARAGVTSRLVRLAKDAIFFLYLYCGYVQLRDLWLSLTGRSRAVVLYYHRIGSRDVLSKPTDEFSRDIKRLKRDYEFISLRDLCERLRSGARSKRRSLVITFDDGYRDNFLEAVPVLEQEGVTATFFVATGFISTDKEFDHDTREARFPKLRWDDLRDMQARGFEIGSHTVNHTNLGSADATTIEREVFDSLAALDRELGERPRAFSFPWGKPSDISVSAIKSVRRAGYYSAASAYGGDNRPGADIFNIRRVDAGNGDMSLLALRARIAGFDPDYFRLKLKGRRQSEGGKNE